MNIPDPYISIRHEEKLESLPDSSGLYFWYFRHIDELFTERQIEQLYLPKVIQYNDYFLLYLGIAEGQSIKERITRKHLKSAHGSTLRHSIGSLLAHKYGVNPFSNVKTGKFAIDEDWGVEKRITEYLEENAKISWIRDEQPKRLETGLLGDYRRLSFPLNINKYPSHQFCMNLKKLRKKYKRI